MYPFRRRRKCGYRFDKPALRTIVHKTNDGEASIPRRVFYDICKAYQPYKTIVISTFVRLLTTFSVVTVIFLLIIQFQVFDEFSEVLNSRVYPHRSGLPCLNPYNPSKRFRFHFRSNVSRSHSVYLYVF